MSGPIDAPGIPASDDPPQALPAVVKPPPGFGGVPLVPPQSPPIQNPTTTPPTEQHESSHTNPSPSSPPHGAPLLQTPPPPGFVPPPFQGFPPPFAGHPFPPPHHPHHPHHPHPLHHPHHPFPHPQQGLPFHPGMPPPPFGFQPGFPPPHFPPGPFGPGAARPGMPFPPQQPLPSSSPYAPPPFHHQGPPQPHQIPPPHQHTPAPQHAEQMISTPQLSRSGIPMEIQQAQAQALAASQPQPLPGDDQPLQFKSNAAQPQSSEDDSWTEATSDEGSVYYYNTKTMETSWDMPKGYKVKSKPKPVSWEKIGDGVWKKVTLDNDQFYYFNTQSKASQWTVPDEVQAILDEQEREKEKEGNDEDEGEGEREAKKLKTDNGEAEVFEDPAAAEAAATAAKISEEEHKKNVETFKEMLKDCKVAPFSKWEKELPKFVSDPRLQLLPRHSERRAVFDQFVRHRLEEEKKEKKAKLKQTHDNFRQLMTEFDDRFNADFTLSEFAKLAEKDERWTSVEAKDRDSLFSERMTPFKQEIEERKKLELEKAKTDFIELLKENSVSSSSTWPRIKVKIDRDPRYKNALLQTADKEDIFKEYLSSLEADYAKRKKREREEASKRDREREVKEQRERGNRELDKRRERLKRDEEEANYRALLSEKIKEPNMSWKEALKVLDSDPRFRTQHLLRDEKDRLFDDHQHSLLEKRIADFKALLIESNLDISIDWKHAKDLIRDDRRYGRLASETEKVKAFDNHIREARKRARETFKELLRETKILTAFTSVEGPEMDNIKDLIRGDKRYAAWNAEKSERDKMIKEHVEELQKEFAARPTKKLVVVDEET